MKLTILLFALCLSLPLATTSCQQAPSERVVAVQTLKIVGTSAKASMDAATQLLKQGAITVPQWQRVALFFDTRWQPAYSAAVAAVRADLSSIASPDLVALGTEFANLVAQLTNKPTP